VEYVDDEAWDVAHFFSHPSFRALRNPNRFLLPFHADAELITSSIHFAVRDY
jgi:hypothetical protein